MSDTKFDEILSLRASGRVKRWHTITTLRQQSDMEHSGDAVSLLLMLHPSPSMNLVKAMMWHDSAERVVGDVPAQVRRLFPVYGEMYVSVETVVMRKDHPTAAEAIEALDELERSWLKAIDVLELFLWAREETKLGNVEFLRVWKRAYDYLMSVDTPRPVLDFVEWFTMVGDKRSFA